MRRFLRCLAGMPGLLMVVIGHPWLGGLLLLAWGAWVALSASGAVLSALWEGLRPWVVQAGDELGRWLWRAAQREVQRRRG